MKSHYYTIIPITVVASLLFGWCHKNEPAKTGNVNSSVTNDARPIAPARLPVQSGTEVTFYPTYGYRAGSDWKMHLRGWAHENRMHANRFVTAVAEIKNKCSEAEMSIFQSRSDDFEDDDNSLEKVVIKFDSDPEDKPYQFGGRSNPNGIVELVLSLSDDKAKQLLDKQGSSNGWLTYRAVSGGHTGLGRVRLIEPEGESLISDIDDTIKVTEVPAGKDTVLRNTFCLEFKAAPDMAKTYNDLSNTPIHYVSGGPEQLFGPLYDYLITGAGGFPEGTFHLNFFPKNLISQITRSRLKRFAARKLKLERFATSSLDDTFDHKISKITELMDRFPNRKFILVGDSGEVDPEVYNEIRRQRGNQVKEIRIRDVINDNDANANPYRLQGMQVIKVDQVVCMSEEHFKNLSAKLEQIYQREYRRNTAPPCNR